MERQNGIWRQDLARPHAALAGWVQTPQLRPPEHGAFREAHPPLGLIQLQVSSIRLGHLTRARGLVQKAAHKELESFLC